MWYKNYFKCKVVGEKHSSDPHFIWRNFTSSSHEWRTHNSHELFQFFYVWISEMHVKVLPAAQQMTTKKNEMMMIRWNWLCGILCCAWKRNENKLVVAAVWRLETLPVMFLGREHKSLEVNFSVHSTLHPKSFIKSKWRHLRLTQLSMNILKKK